MKVFLLGAVGGAIVGYYLAKNHLQQEYEDRYNDAVENAENFYDRKYNPEKFVPKEMPTETVEVERVPTVEDDGDTDIPEPQGPTFTAPVASAMVDYRAYASSAVTSPPASAFPKQEITRIPEPVQHDPMAPEIISGEEFHDGNSGFQQVQYTYYHGDDTLVDVSDDVVNTVTRAETLGSEVIDRLKMGLPSGEDTLYVRVRRFSTEYEIFWDAGMASELIGSAE